MNIPDWVPKEAWEGWVEMRRLKKWPLTERAAKMMIRQLHEWRIQGYDLEWVLDEANTRCWRGLFINERTPRRKQPETFSDAEHIAKIEQGIRDAEAGAKQRSLDRFAQHHRSKFV